MVGNLSLTGLWKVARHPSQMRIQAKRPALNFGQAAARGAFFIKSAP
jgi:hypothetical protein